MIFHNNTEDGLIIMSSICLFLVKEDTKKQVRGYILQISTSCDQCPRKSTGTQSGNLGILEGHRGQGWLHRGRVDRQLHCWPHLEWKVLSGRALAQPICRNTSGWKSSLDRNLVTMCYKYNKASYLRDIQLLDFREGTHIISAL